MDAYALKNTTMLNLGAGERPWRQQPVQKRGQSKVLSDAVTTAPAAKTLEGELLDMFANQGIMVTVGNILSVGVVALLFARHTPAYWPAGWFVVNTAFQVLRWKTLRRLPTPDELLQEKHLKICALISAAGAIIIALSFTAFASLPLVEQALISVIFVSYCVAGVSAASGYAPVFYTYAAIVLGALALAWALAPVRSDIPWINPAMALLITTYGLVLVGNARNIFRAFRQSFETRTQLRELNERLSGALAEAESASRAKTRFLASASHDLRQPIHTLSLFSAALSMQKLDDKTRAIADHMNVALETLASQLDALLDVSKLDAGVMEKHIAVFDLNPMLMRLEQEFRPLCKQKDLRLECGDFHSVNTIETDPALLERVVRNLLSNAVKYTDSGTVSMTTLTRSGQRHLQISDTGRGIPQNEHGRVFEEFYQLDNPERDRSKGLGLGLAIVKRLVNMLDIELILQSSPGQGTSFELKLPLAANVPRSAPKQPQQPEPNPQALRVLVVDDEAEVRAGMQTLLDAMGYSVALADSTEHAVAAARVSAPQLVLADLRLRGTDNGIDAIHAIRTLVPGVPALLISGDTAPDRLKEAQQAGIKLLHKPVAINDLRKSIHEVCGRVS